MGTRFSIHKGLGNIGYGTTTAGYGSDTDLDEDDSPDNILATLLDADEEKIIRDAIRKLPETTYIPPTRKSENDDEPEEEEDNIPEPIESILIITKNKPKVSILNQIPIDWRETDIFQAEYCPDELQDLANRVMDTCEQYNVLLNTTTDKDWIFEIRTDDKEINIAFADRIVEFVDSTDVTTLNGFKLKSRVISKRGRGQIGRWVIVGKTDRDLNRRLALV